MRASKAKFPWTIATALCLTSSACAGRFPASSPPNNVVVANQTQGAAAQKHEKAEATVEKGSLVFADHLPGKIVRRIELDAFNNRTGLEMGLAVIAQAKRSNKVVAVKIERMHHTIFLYVDEGLPADKHAWLRRKAEVAKRFEDSSLVVKLDLQAEGLSLEETFALDSKQYVAKGGAIPIFVKGAGMVAIITVSGLHDQEDHDFIIASLEGRFFDI